ncbi:MAG: tetratricopeptide repeat protein [Ferruginibacter sp.]|nr:tetratricopeptide repeat protein [Chitinophagaceae bacterium]
MKLTLTWLALLMIIISCNNQDHAKENSKRGSETTFAREKILKDSILKFPDLLLLKEELIQLYRDSAAYDKALTITNDALLNDSLNPRLWDIKATLHFENEDTLNAIASFENAFNLNPSPRYLILLGSLYAQTKSKRALLIADALIKTKQPETEKEALFIKGLYHTYTGDKKSAIGFFDKCLNLDNRHMFAYREKGIALYDMGKYDDAVTVLDKAVTLQNNFDEGYYWLGRCLEKLNKPNDAIEEYKTALLYSPDYVEAKDALERLKAQ